MAQDPLPRRVFDLTGNLGEQRRKGLSCSIQRGAALVLSCRELPEVLTHQPVKSRQPRGGLAVSRTKQQRCYAIR